MQRALDPFHAIRCALKRKRWAEDMPDQRLDLDACLAAYTRNAAIAAFEENRLGRLAPGVLADLVMVDGDL
nr:amidohydrolase family protein [Roseovarius salinarum]